MIDIAENLAATQRGIVEACLKRQRNPDEVSIVAVTKKFSTAVIGQGLDQGLVKIGENYAQEFIQKVDSFLGRVIEWHFIGQLQRNKVKKVVGKADLIHSVDSIKLIDAIELHAQKEKIHQKILISVNTSDEIQKSGVSPDQLGEVLEHVKQSTHLNCLGFMTMPPMATEPEESRPYFVTLRELRDRHACDSQPLRELSMGTSGDYLVAVEEGATMVRLGTQIFGSRP